MPPRRAMPTNAAVTTSTDTACRCASFRQVAQARRSIERLHTCACARGTPPITAACIAAISTPTTAAAGQGARRVGGGHFSGTKMQMLAASGIHVNANKVRRETKWGLGSRRVPRFPRGAPRFRVCAAASKQHPSRPCCAEPWGCKSSLAWRVLRALQSNVHPRRLCTARLSVDEVYECVRSRHPCRLGYQRFARSAVLCRF